jgi:hypothetical protein
MRPALLLAAAAALAPQAAQPPAAQPPAAARAPAPARSDRIRSAVRRGVDFLRSVQEKDGSFGVPRNVMFNESFATAPTYEAWTVATTGLCAMALLECGEKKEDVAAMNRAVDFLLDRAYVKRVSEWDTDNVWGYVYGLQGLARLLRAPRFATDPRRKRMEEVTEGLLERLYRWQTPEGGWGYYEGPVVSIPNTWATQFTTAACINGMLDAKAAGVPVDQRRLDKALDAVTHCRLPNGAYTYSVDTISSPAGLEFIHQVKGSLGRIQVGNVALFRAGRLDARALKEGLDLFFEHHRFLAVARKKPIPHESWYAVAAYFHLFGHYYAARAIELLPAESRKPYADQLAQKLLEIQEPDGAFWDFHISEYTRAYGTAFAVMALDRVTSPEPKPADPTQK